MLRRDFQYELPRELIADRPLLERSASRLLVLEGESGQVADAMFRELPALLTPGDLLVFNDTRVFPARLYARKPTGGHVEILIERLLDEVSVLAHVRSSKPVREGTRLLCEGDIVAECRGRRGDLFELHFDQAVLPVLERVGHMPLPPYIQRPDDDTDRERYQTVFARAPGAVAAPTAGLHFDDTTFAALAVRGIEYCFITLNVGAGTFQPVRVDDIAEHRMHAEFAELGQDTCNAIAAARARGGRVIAVGTTSVRTLEAAGRDGVVKPLSADVDLFISPGYRFKVVDLMLTNFHLPESTLLMLVSAFAGHAHTMAAYRHAVTQRYRFFSYGDAMLVSPSAQARRA